MRPSRLFFSASLAAILAGCQTQSTTGNINEFPNDNPTATAAELSRGV